MAGAGCPDIFAIKDVKFARRPVCVECIKTKGKWIHIRVCQACGATLCCDSSPKRHASAHSKETGHPVVSSGELGERWMYCYIHDAYAEYTA